ncbi:MAG TPA: zinc ribbon domain-containing protein [Gaiellaceae bacterium]
MCVVGAHPLSIPCEKANPGIGLYVAGIGGPLMAVGGVQMLSARRTTKPPVADEATKACPECAETVKAAARVCKHRGYRFAPAT